MSTQYQPGIPTGTVPLNQDYLNIQKNFMQLNNTYLVDHVAFNVLSNNGYHTVIHQVTQTMDPPVVSGTNQLYSKVVAGDTALFMESGNGIVQQLSGAFSTTSTNGSVTLPGGIILKWGSLVPTRQTNSNVTFATAFPNACFSVTANLTRTANLNNEDVVYIQAVSKTTFTYRNTSGSSDVSMMYWIAVGN